MKHTLLSKFLSVILSLCVLLCMVPVMGLSVSALDATLDTDGTTILISTAEQLAAIGVDDNYPANGSYKLTNDIDLSGFDSDDNPDNGNWTPLCHTSDGDESPYIIDNNGVYAFVGTLDGQGYTISGMEMIFDKAVDGIGYNTLHIGLFSGIGSQTAMGTVKNLVMKDCHIVAKPWVKAYVGFIVGKANNKSVTISNVAVVDSSIEVEVGNIDNDTGVGSLAGTAANAVIDNVYSDVDIKAGSVTKGHEKLGIGGLVGSAWQGRVKVSGAVFNGTIDNSSHAESNYVYKAAIMGYNWNYPTVSGQLCENAYYNSDKLTPSTATNGSELNGTAKTAAELENATRKDLKLSGVYWRDYKGFPVLSIMLPKTVASYPDYIPIYNAGGLAKIGKDVAYPLSGKYILMNDIDMSDWGNWTPIANPGNTAVTDTNIADGKVSVFTGVFDGAGHTISNMTVNMSGTSVKAGLFGAANGAVVFRNLGIKNSKITATASTEAYAAALVGYVNHSGDYGQISNVSVEDTDINIVLSGKSRTFAGSLCGYGCQIQLNNCYSNADMSVYGTNASRTDAIGAGGFIGRTWNDRIKANDCLFEGTIDLSQDITITEENPEGTALYKAAVLGQSTSTVTASKYSDCYYNSDTLTVSDNSLTYNGTAISADALKAATADSMGFDKYYWANDGEGLYLAVIPANINDDGAIEIDTARKLAAIGVLDYLPNIGSYVLTADIDLSGYANWTPICGSARTAAAGFKGIFDGQGHTVSGMTITQNTKNATAGFFGVVWDSNATGYTEIKNIVFEDCHIDATGSFDVFAGIVVGYLNVDNYNWVHMDNVAVVDSSVKGVATAANNCGIGSIAGSAHGLQMTNIYSNATISGGCTVVNDKFGVGGITGVAYYGRSWTKGAIFDGTLENTTNPESTYINTAAFLGLNNNHSASSPTPVDGNNNSYYNSDKLTPSTATNGGEYNGTENTTFELGISPVSTLGLSGDYWMHNGATPILKIVGDEKYVNGDANGDGKQDILDLIRLKKYMAKVTDEIVPIAVDLKRDQTIDSSDMTYLRKALLGMSNAITVELAKASETVKYLGRAKAENSILLMDWSNTGFELSGIMEGDVTATLTHVSASSSTAEDPYTYARVLVTVDGEESIINVNNGTAVYTLAKDLDFGAHTVKVIKISERTKGKIYGVDVNFVGSIGAKPADKDLVIDFYGDSITAGDGVVKNARQCSDDYLEGQYANLTYAAKTAKALDADMRVAANSGLKTKDAVSKLIDAGSWDYENNQADIVVINLGTNDKWVIWDDGDNDSTTAATGPTELGIANEKAAIIAMLDAVRAKYGADTKIVWVYGMMGNSLADNIQPVVEEYAANDANVYYCELPANTLGGGSHPTEAGHAAAAAILAQHISSLLTAE